MRIITMIENLKYLTDYITDENNRLYCWYGSKTDNKYNVISKQSFLCPNNPNGKRVAPIKPIEYPNIRGVTINWLINRLINFYSYYPTRSICLGLIVHRIDLNHQKKFQNEINQ